MKPINFIKTLAKSDKYIEVIFMNGGCYQFYKVLKTVFPGSKPYINVEKNHVVTKIDGEFYDISGHVKGEFYPLHDKAEIEMCKRWGFSKDYYLTKQCLYCEEPVPIIV